MGPLPSPSTQIWLGAVFLVAGVALGLFRRQYLAFWHWQFNGVDPERPLWKAVGVLQAAVIFIVGLLMVTQGIARS
jgi:hypothetical protein